MNSGDSPSNVVETILSASTNDTVNSSNVRGKCKCTWNENNIREDLEFNSEGFSVGINDSRFSKYLGKLARDNNSVPLIPKSWSAISTTDKNILWEKIHATIAWKPEDEPRMPIIKQNIMERVDSAWRRFKNRLKTTYYLPNIGKAERWICGDGTVDANQWREMVKHWDSEKTTSIAKKRSYSRKQQKYSHTSGTKSYARSRAEYTKKHGREPDPIEFFVEKHTRKDEQRTWINENSKQTHAMMQETLEEIVGAEGDETMEMRERAYVAVMGPEPRHRVRAYGLGVTPDMVHDIQDDGRSSARRVSGRAYAQMQSHVMELQAKYQQQEAKYQQQEERGKLQQAELLQTQQELAIFKQFLLPQQPTPPSQHSSGPVEQPSIQMPSYPPQMYWQPQHPYPQMPYHPRPVYPSSGLTGLLMGEAGDTDTLNQFPSTFQSTQGSE